MGIPQNLLLITASLLISFASACSDGPCGLLDKCSSDQDCEDGLFCFYCIEGFSASKCVRSTATDQFRILNNSLPFNKYAFLTTHNAFAIAGYPSRTGIPRLTVTNQEDNVTQQLNNGVRALMLDTYDFRGDVWLCHSFKGQCHDYTAFGPAIDTLKEIEEFLSANPSEIVTLILEDYVQAPKGLTRVFYDSGLMKYWVPVTMMAKHGQDWPLVSDMVKNNHRLLVFTSIKSKEKSEGIAYQWNYMVENQYGDGGMHPGSCSNRPESSALSDKSKSLVLVNYFRSIPMKELTCIDNSAKVLDMLQTCYAAAGNRWANFVAVNYYKRSEGGGSFQAVDSLNGKLLCGCDDIRACLPGSSSAACTAQDKLQ
ncbi:PI-PLC X domain-containing protein At5g67130 isoform X2 [Ricinus communis]|uniref:Phospholipase C, putative n=1 Tax=Ricinus communis TaxID=3988 RepID=B9SYD5_RICCO|nr:PI-PLC X domain-containing protein At5g67130 isoform X2 [Ricinus communis]EEF31392.1 phospholipase C, putative [Ricinus communis]|eukprot:XP_002531004.1 PI-PLC X domain-containing protein At5g67130 isoform X1 [Ricinus communis]